MTADGLAQVAASGDSLATLEALRDRIALQIDSTDSARDVASLSARLVEVLNEIKKREKPDEEEANPLAEVLKLAREAGAKSPRRPA